MTSTPRTFIQINSTAQTTAHQPFPPDTISAVSPNQTDDALNQFLEDEDEDDDINTEDINGAANVPSKFDDPLPLLLTPQRSKSDRIKGYLHGIAQKLKPRQSSDDALNDIN